MCISSLIRLQFEVDDRSPWSYELVMSARGQSLAIDHERQLTPGGAVVVDRDATGSRILRGDEVRGALVPVTTIDDQLLIARVATRWRARQAPSRRPSCEASGCSGLIRC